MTTGIWITIIICGTLLLLAIIAKVGTAIHKRKMTNELSDAFKKIAEIAEDDSKE